MQAQSPEKTPIQATDVLRVRRLGDVRVSPDHRSIAYTVRQAVRSPDSTYTYRTHLWAAPTSGRRSPYPLTRGSRSASQPAWDPSGERLAFVREVDGMPQVFVLPFYGGEAYQLTSYEHGAQHPRWSPDGKRLLFSAQLPRRAVQQSTQQAPSQRSRNRPVGSASAKPDPDGSLDEARAWLDENHERDPAARYRHLFVQEVNPNAAPRDVTPGPYSFEGGMWLPNSTQIAVSSSLGAPRRPGRTRDRDLFLIDVLDGTRYSLLDMEGYAVYAPRVSPDGQHVAFLARTLDGGGYAQTELGRYALNGRSAPKLLTTHFDRSVRQPRWDPDSWHLYFTASSRGGVPLYRLAAFGESPTPQADTLAARAAMLDTLTADKAPSADTRTPLDTLITQPDSVAPAANRAALSPQQITSDTTGVGSFDLSPGSIFYVRTSVSNPYELYVDNVRGTMPRRLTSHNAQWLQNRVLARMTAHTLQREDGLNVDYWTMKPAAFREGRSYPMLLAIPGGPMTMWGPGKAATWHEFQFLAGKGYGIVFSNPRGSGGYGNAFKRVSYRNWLTGPASDVLAAADSALAGQPWLDADQQLVTGGSNAGYLASWILSRTDRFRAAVAQRGVYGRATFRGDGNAWRLAPSRPGDSPPGVMMDTLSRRASVLDIAVSDTTASHAASTTDTTLTAPDTTAPSAAGVVTPVSTGSAADTTLAVETASTALPSPDTSRADGFAASNVTRRTSPLTYTRWIHTPLLIMHGEQERRGSSQSLMLYRALTILERPVEYVRYPNAGRDLSRTGAPRQHIDRLLRTWAFFERYAE